MRHRWRKPKQRAKGRDKVDRFDWSIDGNVLADVRPHRHHPGGSGEWVTCPMVLKAVAAGIAIGIAAKIRQYKHCRFSEIFWLALRCLPYLPAQTIGPLDALQIKRVGSGVRDVHVMERYPQQAGRKLLHQLAHYIDRKLIWARQTPGMRSEIRD